MTHFVPSLEQISPQLLRCSYFNGLTLSRDNKMRPRVVCDYEIEYIVDGDGQLLVDGICYPLLKGSLVFRKPGQYVQGIPPYSCYLICLDLQSSTGKSPHAYDFYAENSLQALFIHPLLEAIPSVSIPPVTDGKNMQFLFEQLLDLFINRNEVNLLLQKAIVLQIIYQIITAVTPQYNHTNLPPSPHHKTLKKVLNYIERNFHQPIQLKDLASLAQLSPAHLHKIFTKTLAITPNQFILNRRLQKAKECLLKTDVAIYTVADLCGFQNAAYFTTVFHQVVGCTPSEFRLKSSYL